MVNPLIDTVKDGLRGILGQGRSRTAAIVQFEAVHEEVVLSVVRALQANGITPTVYLNENILKRRGDLFAFLAPGAFEYHYVPLEGRMNWNLLKARLMARAGDSFVFLNTFQRDGAANFAKSLKRPVLGIVHNPELFLQSEACLSLSDQENVGLVTLADHVTSYLIARRPQLADRISTLETVYWGNTLAEPQKFDGRRRIVAPGAVNFKNRSYDFIFNAFKRDPKLAQHIEIRIVGGGPDRTSLEERVSENGLENSITFSPCDLDTGFVGHETYFADLRTASFTLPLLPANRQDYRVYKITLALPTAQGFCIPPIVDRWTDIVYRVPGITTLHADPAHALQKAAQIDDATYTALQKELMERRMNLLQRNDAEMEYLLQKLGLATASSMSPT